MTNEFRLALIWLFAGTAGVFMAINAVGGSFNGVEYLPVSNDSFYHARRILDAVANPSAFFEFDDRIHVPEGSWINWPWLYDYMMARIVAAAMFVTGTNDPKAILAHIPVIWVYINVLLMMVITRQLGFGYLATLLASLGIALSPLTQALHATGMIDHHFAELTCILLTILGGLRWFADPDSVAKGAFLGFVMGISSGFHNGLFVLQIPILATAYLIWYRGFILPRHSMMALALGLSTGTVLVLLGSEPFWQGMFGYYYLSLFHLYVAFCTSILLLLITGRPFAMRWLIICACVALLMTLPVVGEALSMGSFLQKDIARFELITETESMLSALRRNPGAYLLGQYTLLVVLTPIVFVSFCRMAIREKSVQWIFFAVIGLFCLALFFSQLRFRYFGLCVLVLSPLLLARWWAGERKWPIWLSAALVAFYGIAYAEPVINRIERNWPLGLDDQYRLVYPSLPSLTQACAEDPGVVLAYNDLGHYIRYHTDCRVIANNFLLTQQHQEKIAELDQLFGLEIEELASSRPEVKYVLVGFPKLYIRRPDGGSLPMSREQMIQANARWPLMIKLLLQDDYGADRLELLHEQRVTTADDDFALVKLFKIRPVEAQTPE